jgi:hypothetical protein
MPRTWVQVRIHIFVLSTGITPFEAGLAVPTAQFEAKIYKSRDM